MIKSNCLEYLFKISMIWRMIYGGIKFISGLFLLKLLPQNLASIFYTVMAHEISEDPHNILINFIGSHLEKISINTITFIAVYLIIWGIIDLITSFSLLKKILFFFPITMFTIALFTAYEIKRFFHTHSSILLLIIIIDIFIISIIYREYNRLKTSNDVVR